MYSRPTWWTYPRQLLFGFLSLLAPMRSRPIQGRVVMSAFHGDGYRGNTAVLFEALMRHDTLRPVWLSRNKDLVLALNRRFGHGSACLTHSVDGIKVLAAAHFILFTHGTSDFPFMRLPTHATIIQTYHGLPTKRGEYFRRDGDAPPSVLERLVYWHRYRRIDCFLSSSPLVTEIFSKRFGLPQAAFVETGYPCTDRLLHPSDRSALLARCMPPDLAARNPRIWLYAPTFRTESRTRWFPFADLDAGELNRFLEERNLVILIRRHPNDGATADTWIEASPRIRDAGHETVEDVNELLVMCDGILTDYSGIALDGLLRDIPTVYLPYDVERYERGFPIPFEQFSPGPKPRTAREFMDALDGIPFPDWRNERERVKRLYFSEPDGRATERVIRFLEKRMVQRPLAQRYNPRFIRRFRVPETNNIPATPEEATSRNRDSSIPAQAKTHSLPGRKGMRLSTMAMAMKTSQTSHGVCGITKDHCTTMSA